MARPSASSFGWLRGFGTRISLFLLILVSVGLLVQYKVNDNNQQFSGVRQVTDDVTSPISNAITTPMWGTKRAWGFISSHWNAAKRVRQLEAENQTLRQWEALSHALHNKIVRYEQLLQIQGQPDLRVLSARVIAETRGPFVRSVLLRVGRRDGVRQGQAVVGPNGLIGRIVTVGNHSSRVLLVTDLNSRIPVQLEGSNTRAILAGDNQGNPKLIYMGKSFVPVAGTRISTSGDDGVLPAGIAVGELLTLQSSDVVRVRTYADLSAIDFVQVLAQPSLVPPEAEITEPVPAQSANTTGDVQ